MRPEKRRWIDQKSRRQRHQHPQDDHRRPDDPDDAAQSLGLHPREAYAAGLAGALCDEATKGRLREIGEAYDWNALAEAPLLS